MKYVILVSHGEFALGLHSAVIMMTGDREDILSTSLKDGMGTPEFIENFKMLIDPLQDNDEIILLADILSGSPFTSALTVLDERGFLDKALVIAGVNLPLAITAVLMKDSMDNEMLKANLLSEGHAGLCVFEALNEDTEEDI